MRLLWERLCGCLNRLRRLSRGRRRRLAGGRDGCAHLRGPGRCGVAGDGAGGGMWVAVHCFKMLSSARAGGRGGGRGAAAAAQVALAMATADVTAEGVVDCLPYVRAWRRRAGPGPVWCPALLPHTR